MKDLENEVFMLLIMNDESLNQNCGFAFTKQLGIDTIITTYPNKMKDDHSNELFILDVVGLHRFSLEKSAKTFADELIKMGLPHSIKDIYFIMSDLEISNSLINFANELANALAEFHDRNIRVHTPTHLGYDITIVFPKENGRWQIYGLYDDGIIGKKIVRTNSNIDFDFINTLKNKTLLWEGVDLKGYLDHPQKTYVGINYTWSE